MTVWTLGLHSLGQVGQHFFGWILGFLQWTTHCTSASVMTPSCHNQQENHVFSLNTFFTFATLVFLPAFFLIFDAFYLIRCLFSLPCDTHFLLPCLVLLLVFLPYLPTLSFIFSLFFSFSFVISFLSIFCSKPLLYILPYLFLFPSSCLLFLPPSLLPSSLPPTSHTSVLLPHSSLLLCCF